MKLTNMTNSIIFTDSDLDGAGSFLVFKWLFKDEIKNVQTLRVSTLRESLLKWLNNNSFEKYDKIYFLDLDTSSIGDLIDKQNVIIFDHHETHSYDYKNAKLKLVLTTSCTKILYNEFKSLNKFSIPQIKLLSLIDDYDCYALKDKNSLDLNILFWAYNGDRLTQFCDRFKDGFNGFTKPENNLINSYKRKLEKYYNNLKLYTADIKIKDKTYKFYGAFADKYVNDIAQNILDDNKECEIVILINNGNKRVYLRKKKGVDVNLGKFAEKVCAGGGHDYAAGGILTEHIKTLSKDFYPINE